MVMEAWRSFLVGQGARFDGTVATAFGDGAAELEAARSGTVLCDLSHRGLIAVNGKDSENFLQGQLSNDVTGLQGAVRRAAYCTAKGRMFALFLVWRDGEDFMLELPADVAEATRKRLSMYVLRAKVVLRDASAERVRIGLAGPRAGEAIAAACSGAAPQPMSTVPIDGGCVLGLEPGRFELVLSVDAAQAAWRALAQFARPVGAEAWGWTEVRAGIPEVVAATQEAFVPQMANLDALGGISFTKGCYPGQEIVARTRYLGTVKRRMLPAHVDAAPPQPGATLTSPALPDQSAGTVVRAALAPEGGCDLLAVVHVDGDVPTGELRLGTPDGPRLDMRPLPYAL